MRGSGGSGSRHYRARARPHFFPDLDMSGILQPADPAEGCFVASKVRGGGRVGAVGLGVGACQGESTELLRMRYIKCVGVLDILPAPLTHLSRLPPPLPPSAPPPPGGGHAGPGLFGRGHPGAAAGGGHDRGARGPHVG